MLQKCEAKLHHTFQHLNSVIGPTPPLDSSSSLSDMSEDIGSYSPSAANSDGFMEMWDDLFGTGWHGNHLLHSTASRDVNLELEESLPDLEPARTDNGDDGYSGTGSFDSEILDVNADDEMSNADSTDLDFNDDIHYR